jgi:hypothetical protein
MANEIAERIAKSALTLTRKEKAANRETVRKRAGLLEEKAFVELGKLLSDRKTPANAKTQAINTVLDRIAGKPKLVDEKQGEQTALEKMSAPELVEYITQQFSGLPLSVRAVMGESLDKGLAFDAADIMEAIEEPAPAQSREPKPKKIPRR